MQQDRLGRAVDLGVLLVGQERRRRLLDQLLVPALQRAVAGRHDHDVAVLVGQALRLDVPRPVEVALDEALAAAERGDGLADRRLVQLGDLFDRPGHLQAATAAAERRLDRDREAVLLGERDDLVGARHRIGVPATCGAPDRLSDVPRLHLVAERPDRLRRRTDPGQPGVDDRLGEVGVLGQEAVAGVHGVRAGARRDLEDLVDVEVGLGRWSPSSA